MGLKRYTYITDDFTTGAVSETTDLEVDSGCLVSVEEMVSDFLDRWSVVEMTSKWDGDVMVSATLVVRTVTVTGNTRVTFGA